MRGDHHDHISEALEAIDRELGRKPLTIEESIMEAVGNGKMSPEEGAECLDCYQRTFARGIELYSDPPEAS